MAPAPQMRMDPAAIHAERVVGSDGIALRAEGDEAGADAVARHDHLDDLLRRLLERLAAIGDAGRDVVADDATDEELALARAGHRADAVPRVGARADDRAVANAPHRLVVEAAGGGAGREMPHPVTRNRADRAMLLRLAGMGERAAPRARLQARQRVDPALGGEPAGLDHLEPGSRGEGVGGGPCQQHGLTRRHHRTGGRDRIADAPDAADRAGRERLPVHDRRVEFMLARLVQGSAVARVEVRAVLEGDDGGLDSLRRPPSGGENRPAGAQGAGDVLTGFSPFGLAHQAAVEGAAASVQAERDPAHRVSGPA